MATNLKYGSSGEEVKQLQNALINAGYDVGSSGADGVLGKNTDSAIRQYQKDNGLDVDGIAGKNTLGKLYSNNGAQAAGSNAGAGAKQANAGGGAAQNGTFTTPAGNTYETFTPEEVTYDPLVYSDTVNQAFATLGQQIGNAPGAFTDPNNYKDKYLGYAEQYENRDPFSYDFNSDALYQQYKDQYIQQGQMAMMDTMGQAAAMTGGYGNSYAQTVGQQAYNQQLNELNNIMPELYQMAYERYGQEGQELLDMYNMYLGLYQNDYNMYLGDVDNYYKQLGATSDYAFGLADKERNEWADKTGLDIDIANNKNSIGLDTWATQLGITSGENQTLMNQKFQAEENAKSQAFTASQNKLDRDAKIEAAAIEAAAKTPLDTEATLTWIKKFESVTSLSALETLASQFEDVVGYEVAGKWFDLYADGFADEIDDEPENGGAGGGGGTMYWDVR
jgi:peptidoglycan hydrolase-like protein with peptidoglycan-binding domain